MGVNNYWWGLDGSTAIRVSTTDMLNGTNSAYNVGSYDYFAWTVPYTNASCTINYGQKPFKFPPPEGFQPLNATNTRPVKVITRPDQYVGVVTYTGAGATKTVTDLNFNATPDLIWLKNRDRASYGDGTAAHFFLYDSVRGTGTSKSLTITTTEQEGSKSTEADLDAFVRNGFRLDAASGTDCINNDGDDFWACCWRAGGKDGSNAFNIDGVGYANASDVNMSAGALNNTYYNQSVTWSGATETGGSNLSKLFDGNLLNAAEQDSVGTRVVVTGFGPITVSKSVEFYSPDGDAAYTLNNGRTHEFFGAGGHRPGWHKIPFTGTLTSFSWIGNSARIFIYGMRVDGRELVDNGTSVKNQPTIAASACSVGTKQGFSIIQYSGSNTDFDSIPHGLTQEPDFFVLKARNKTDDFRVYHKGIGTGRYAMLNSQNTNSASNWRNLSSTTVSLQNDSAINGNYNYIGYFWHDVPGLQKFGSYRGNGSTDGAFIELGFKPAVFMCRCVSTNGDWWNLFDSERKTSNPATPYLEFGNAARQEQTANLADFLSNGVKLRFGTGNQLNGSNQEYIYMAWAAAPSIDLYGGQPPAF
jgi:hypothetical protein